MTNRIERLVDRSRYAALALLVAGLFPVSSNAEMAAGSFAIEVLDARYSTELSYRLRYPSDTVTTATQTITGSPVPLDSELYYCKGCGYPTGTGAEATADMFSVSAYTFGGGGSSGAIAQTTLTFRPLEDGDASLTFAGLGEHPFYSTGSLSLFNLTAGQDLFSYSWCGLNQTYPCNSGDLLFPWTGALNTSLQLSPFLLASDTYVLNLRAVAGGSDAGTSVSLAVSGLQPISPIPEPSTYAMMLVSLSVVGLAARRRKRLIA